MLLGKLGSAASVHTFFLKRHRVPYKTKAVERNRGRPQDQCAGRHASARQELDAHVGLQFTVELLADPVSVVEPHALLHRVQVVRTPAIDLYGGDEKALSVGEDGPLDAFGHERAAEVLHSGGFPVTAEAAVDGFAVAWIFRLLAVAYAVKQLKIVFAARIALNKILDVKVSAASMKSAMPCPNPSAEAVRMPFI